MYTSRNLKSLSLSGMISVKDQESTINRLKELLPNCEINPPDKNKEEVPE